MTKPRYDEQENVSRHAAVRKEDCEQMQRKYGWQVVDIEKLPATKNQLFKVDFLLLDTPSFLKQQTRQNLMGRIEYGQIHYF